ncbi:hypothetical protein ACFQ07_26865, partial [Actinomadura adrarensis]
AVLALEQRGWRRSTPVDGGYQQYLYREVPSGLFVHVKLDPGMKIGHGADNPDQRLAEIRLDTAPDERHRSSRTGRPFGDLDLPTASEFLSELIEATAHR